LHHRKHAPLRPSGGRGRGPSRSGGRVRWAVSRTGWSATLTLPSPPGRRGERISKRRCGKFLWQTFVTMVLEFSPDSPGRLRGEGRDEGPAIWHLCCFRTGQPLFVAVIAVITGNYQLEALLRRTNPRLPAAP
jgi:hypothetical protein